MAFQANPATGQHTMPGSDFLLCLLFRPGAATNGQGRENNCYG